MICFVSEPSKATGSSTRRVGKPGRRGAELIEKSFHGPLSEQVRDALRYLQSNAIREKVIKHKDRAEATRIYNYPY